MSVSVYASVPMCGGVNKGDKISNAFGYSEVICGNSLQTDKVCCRGEKRRGKGGALLLTCTWSHVSAALCTSPGSCLGLHKQSPARKQKDSDVGDQYIVYSLYLFWMLISCDYMSLFCKFRLNISCSDPLTDMFHLPEVVRRDDYNVQQWAVNSLDNLEEILELWRPFIFLP